MEKIELIGQDLDVYKETLDNGLEVYMIPYEKKNNYYITYVTKFGSINLEFKSDGKAQKVPAGIAHFLEHKMFDTADGGDTFAFFAKSGTECNASTSHKRTRYWISGTNNMENNLEYFVNFLNSPYYTDETTDKEKDIIIEELNMYKNMPNWKISNELYKNTFKKHPIRIDIGGTTESVRSTTKEDLYTCYNTFYQPTNMALVVAGVFDKDHILEIIKNNKILKERTNIVQFENKTIKEPEEINIAFKELSMSALQIPKLAFAIKTKLKNGNSKNNHEYRLYISMILNILYGASSKFREEAGKKGLMTSLSIETVYLNDIMVLEFNADTEKPHELIEGIISHFKNTKITIEELERCKKVWIASTIYATDIVSETANFVANSITEYGLVLNNRIGDIKKASLKEINKVKETISIENRSVIIAKPKKNKRINENKNNC